MIGACAAPQGGEISGNTIAIIRVQLMHDRLCHETPLSNRSCFLTLQLRGNFPFEHEYYWPFLRERWPHSNAINKELMDHFRGRRRKRWFPNPCIPALVDGIDVKQLRMNIFGSSNKPIVWILSILFDQSEEFEFYLLDTIGHGSCLYGILIEETTGAEVARYASN
jgi:hypothetical protein